MPPGGQGPTRLLPGCAAGAHRRDGGGGEERVADAAATVVVTSVSKGRRTTQGRRWPLWLTLAVVVALAGVGIHAFLAQSAAAPAFTLAANTGGTVSLSSYRGRPVLVEFMATWCMYCAWEAKYVLPQLQAAAAGQGFAILAVDASDRTGIATPGPYDDPGAGRDGAATPLPTVGAEAAAMHELDEYAATFGLRFPLLYDPGLLVTQAYHVTAYPTLVVIGASGRIDRTFVGPQPAATLLAELAAAAHR